MTVISCQRSLGVLDWRRLFAHIDYTLVVGDIFGRNFVVNDSVEFLGCHLLPPVTVFRLEQKEGSSSPACEPRCPEESTWAGLDS